jgi:hypothetical protein
MRKTIDYDLNFVTESGETKTQLLKISFISNGIIRDFNSHMRKVYEIKELWSEVSNLETEIMALRIERPENWKSLIDEKQEAITAKTVSICSFQTEEILQERFELIKKILLKNGYGAKKFLFDFDFWDNCVDPADTIGFLTQCVWKDVDKKKVQ